MTESVTPVGHCKFRHKVDPIELDPSFGFRFLSLFGVKVSRAFKGKRSSVSFKLSFSDERTPTAPLVSATRTSESFISPK